MIGISAPRLDASVLASSMLAGALFGLGCSKGEDASASSAAPGGSTVAASGVASSTSPATAREWDASAILKESVAPAMLTADRLDRLTKAPLYRIDVDLDLELFTYDGALALTVTNQEKEALTELNFLLYPNSAELSPDGVKHLAVSDVRVGSTSVTAKSLGDRLKIPLPAPLAPGATANVTFDFRGLLHRQAPGAGDMAKQAMQQLMQLVMGEQHGGYGVFGVGDGIVSLGLWYPILAAYDENGWDVEPGGGVGDVSYFDASNYVVTLTVAKDVAVATTGVEVPTDAGTSLGDARRRRQFVAGAAREFTLMASPDFVEKRSVVDGVTVRSWSMKAHEKSGQTVLTHAENALGIFGREFGPYAYTELDLVEAPLVGGAGGVEFPGLVTIGSMFYSPDLPNGGDPVAQAMATSGYLADTLEFVVAHEVAHEWWNAAVGSDSKRHPFIDEALANHSALLHFERVHGKAVADTQRSLQVALPYQLARLTGADDRPVALGTSEFNGMMEYAGIVYGKGALFFDAMREHLGDDAHFAFLRDYYRRFTFETAHFDDLVGGLIAASREPKSAEALANRWLTQTHGDEDIGDIDVVAILPALFGGADLPPEFQGFLRFMQSRDAKELGGLVKTLLSDEGLAEGELDWATLIRLGTKLIGQLGGQGDEPSPTGAGSNIGMAPSGDPNPSGDDAMRHLVKGVLKAAVGDDPEIAAAIDAADVILKLVMDSPEP
ncbi:MAG: M1 family metallopeptidase [Myxococcales bacterium]|nr:M1 family metallopeptidase [Myxococcales bacterium]